MISNGHPVYLHRSQKYQLHKNQSTKIYKTVLVREDKYTFHRLYL